MILLSRELHAEDDHLRRLFKGLMVRFHERLATEVERGQRHGRFRPAPAAADAGLLLIGLVQGLCLRWTLSGRAFPLAAEGRRLAQVQLDLLSRPRPALTEEETPA